MLDILVCTRDEIIENCTLIRLAIHCQKNVYDAQEVDYESDVTTWQDDCDVVIDEKSDTDEGNLSRSLQLYKLF